MGSKSNVTKEEKKQALALFALGREYVIDVIAAGILKSEVLKLAATDPHSVSSTQNLARLRACQQQLHERIQHGEAELVTEIAKNV